MEKQPGSVSKLQIELPPEEVSKEWDAIANSFARFAKIPGYRPGKAPRTVIDKRFRKEIQDELTKKLVSKSYHEAVEQEQLRVASLTNIEDIQFGEDKSMRFRATVVTAPEFELPEYKNIPVQLPDTKVSEAEIDAALGAFARSISGFCRCAGPRTANGRFCRDRFRRFGRRQADQRNCAAGEQEFARRQEILAASGAGQFSAEILRAIGRTKAGRNAAGDRRFPGGFSGERTGREKSGLRRYAARD